MLQLSLILFLIAILLNQSSNSYPQYYQNDDNAMNTYQSDDYEPNRMYSSGFQLGKGQNEEQAKELPDSNDFKGKVPERIIPPQEGLIMRDREFKSNFNDRYPNTRGPSNEDSRNQERLNDRYPNTPGPSGDELRREEERNPKPLNNENNHGPSKELEFVEERNSKPLNNENGPQTDRFSNSIPNSPNDVKRFKDENIGPKPQFIMNESDDNPHE
jgi:hypothetical protein